MMAVLGVGEKGRLFFSACSLHFPILAPLLNSHLPPGWHSPFPAPRPKSRSTLGLFHSLNTTSTKQPTFLSHHPPSNATLTEAKNIKLPSRPAAGLSLGTLVLGQPTIPDKIKHKDYATTMEVPKSTNFSIQDQSSAFQAAYRAWCSKKAIAWLKEMA